MTGLGPRAVVPAPPATPPRLSLVASAAVLGNVTDVEANRVDIGFKFAPESCEAGTGRTDPCAGTVRDIPDDANPDAVDTVAWSVWAADQCSTFDRTRDREGRARRLLLACESKQIAAELWTGTLAQEAGDWPNRRLASPASDEITPAPVDPVVAMSLLERGLQLCSCGGRGMIHATADLVTRWIEKGLVKREGNLLTTALDTIVVTDAGYDGSGPAGEPAIDGSVWAYATGLVLVRRGEITVTPDSTVDPRTNTQTVYAERLAAATWDGCCHLAAEVDIDIPRIGGS